MFLSKLNDSLGVLANIGILVGLVFVGMEYRNNTSLIEIEADSNVGSRINDIVNLVVSDQHLIEIMGKEKHELTDIESDRLRLLGLRMFLALESVHRDAVLRETGGLARSAQINRAIYHRLRLNYGLPHAWETFKARGETSFTEWFEETVVAEPPSA